MDWISFGMLVRDAILAFAKLITLDHWPGLISSGLFAFFLLLAGWMFLTMLRRKALLDHLTAMVRATVDSSGFQKGLNGIEGKLKARKSPDAKRIAEAVSEFRKTLLEPAKDGEANIRNAFRPSTFINLDNLHFGLSSWRVWPGLFVSIGLLLTFLGLIAALAATQQTIHDGGGNQQETTKALELLLGTASAKFTMSLTGLFCSILFTLLQRRFSGLLEHSVSALAGEMERKMDFVSLERLADHQLSAIEEQTKQQQLLNTQLIAELSKPLERMTATGTEAIGGMVMELGKSLTSNIGASLDRVAERIDGAAETLATLSSSLSDASKRFEETLEQSVTGLDAVVRRMEMVTEKLSSSAESVASAATPVMETAKSTSDLARTLADGSVQLVGAAKTAIEAERTVVVTSAKSIEELIRAFEGRAKAYDGQLEKAFITYVEQVQRTLGELRSHGDGVHDRYADALQTLQAVIENARAFRPESDAPKLERSDA